MVTCYFKVMIYCSVYRYTTAPPIEPDFGVSGLLAAETNTVNGVTLVYVEPQEAKKPTVRWRLYVFKDGELQGDPLYIHRQSYYLLGRERKVVDLPTVGGCTLRESSCPI
jgi:hypothetical protein